MFTGLSSHLISLNYSSLPKSDMLVDLPESESPTKMNLSIFVFNYLSLEICMYVCVVLLTTPSSPLFEAINICMARYVLDG